MVDLIEKSLYILYKLTYLSINAIAVFLQYLIKKNLLLFKHIYAL